MITMSDRDLVLQLQEGSLEALGILYDRHRHMVYRSALAITGNPEAASDLLQDVFLRLHRFSSHIDRDRPLEPWLYRMTANLAYTWMRRNHRGLRLLEEVAEWFISNANKATPHELVEEHDAWDQVQRAMQGLPLQQRIVVVMYYLNDLSLQEISEALEIPVGTVKSRLHYGRLALQHSLELRQLAKEYLPELQYEST